MQLTSQGINCHMYFTGNPFDLDGREIYFVSDRGSESGHFNLFRMDLSSGEMTQLTDEAEGIVFNAFTKTPDSELIAYKSGNSVHILNTRTMENRVIYTDNDICADAYQSGQKDAGNDPQRKCRTDRRHRCQL